LSADFGLKGNAYKLRRLPRETAVAAVASATGRGPHRIRTDCLIGQRKNTSSVYRLPTKASGACVYLRRKQHSLPGTNGSTATSKQVETSTPRFVSHIVSF
jgi:hypothetical protein